MADDLLLQSDHGPTRADALQNRARLLDAARKLFDEQGVHAVSMTAIAQEAGVGKGTLYRHFENKTDLCFALLDERQRELQERSFKRFNLVQDPINNLRWFLAEVLAYVEQNMGLLCVESQEQGFSSLGHPAHSWWRHTIYRLLQQAGVQGDTSYFADVFFLMLDVHTIYFQQTTLGYDSERILNGLYETLQRFLT